MKQQEDPRAWLRPLSHKQSLQSNSEKGQEVTDMHTSPHRVSHGLTATMCKAGEYQNMLTAVPYPHKRTGFKDPGDPSNRSDKHNGGNFKRFESSYSKHYADIDDKPIQFREDGLPISAQRLAGKPLMAPKRPNSADLNISKRLTVKYHHQSQVRIGNPQNKDPKQFESVYQISMQHRSEP